MRAVCCDRCERFEKIPSKDWLPEKSWRRLVVELMEREIVLCPDCGEAFDAFLAGGDAQAEIALLKRELEDVRKGYAASIEARENPTGPVA